MSKRIYIKSYCLLLDSESAWLRPVFEKKICTLYPNEELSTLRIRLSEKDIEKMEANLESRYYFEIGDKNNCGFIKNYKTRDIAEKSWREFANIIIESSEKQGNYIINEQGELEDEKLS